MNNFPQSSCSENISRLQHSVRNKTEYIISYVWRGLKLSPRIYSIFNKLDGVYFVMASSVYFCICPVSLLRVQLIYFELQNYQNNPPTLNLKASSAGVATGSTETPKALGLHHKKGTDGT